MKMSMYEASAPAFIRGLTALKTVLVKGQAYAAAKKIDDAVMVNLRLFPDMLPLKSQVHVATDFSRGAIARLAGGEPPKWEDNETTLAELIARVDRAIEAIKSFTKEQVDGSEEREITRPVRGVPKTFTGINYLRQSVLPNFYFHVTTAYAILRSNGVELGKADFIGPVD